MVHTVTMNPSTILYHPEFDRTKTNPERNRSDSQGILWQHLKESKMHGFDFDQLKKVDQYVLDFYSSKLRLGIELNASSEPMDSLAENEMIRQKYFKISGIKLVRFWEDDIYYDLENVLNMIELSVLVQKRRL